ncbi:MAG: hypothetical protein KKA61_01675 [Nanoarchaeota archaeon]|nr:hypothetical protein [Nanoarchaeota archaeon]MBU4284178.1 hypothetical protein [Nanoarchaeota archaeon]MBU4493055.1 hypothetical protein [Nanoarchaeota archaeon]
MERFGRGISSVKPIMDYARENMATDKIIKEVKKSVKEVKKFMKKFNP